MCCDALSGRGRDSFPLQSSPDWGLHRRKKLGKFFEEGGTDVWTRKDVVEATFGLELETCQIFWEVPSW